MGARWNGEERRLNPRLQLENERRAGELVALATPEPAPEWERLQVWQEVEQAAWVELRMTLLEATLPLAVVVRDVLGGLMPPAWADVELAVAQANDPATNYGAF